MQNKAEKFQEALNASEAIINNGQSRDEKLLAICQVLADKIDYYDWVGFYLVDPEKERELFLGPYVGEETDHTRIPFGKGICGQAAEREETFVIQDVSEQDNYLACSIHVKSEIVLPIFKDGKVIGELDIDSHTKNPYTAEDSKYLEALCEKLSALF